MLDQDKAWNSILPVIPPQAAVRAEHYPDSESLHKGMKVGCLSAVSKFFCYFFFKNMLFLVEYLKDAVGNLTDPLLATEKFVSCSEHI